MLSFIQGGDYMNFLIGWILTLLGLVLMLGFGFTTLISIYGLTYGKINIVWSLIYVVVTATSYMVWRFGGKLRSKR